MEILETRNKFITNEEVFKHIKSTRYEFLKPPKKNYHKMNNTMFEYEILTKKLMAYFKKTPCNHQNLETVKKYVTKELSKYELEVIEKFQIVNLVPKSTVNLYSIVEECDARFSEEQCENIISSLREYFPDEFKDVEEGGEADEEAGNNVDADGDEHMADVEQDPEEVQIEKEQKEQVQEKQQEEQEQEEEEEEEEEEEGDMDRDDELVNGGTHVVEDYEGGGNGDDD
ncbi:hypothetical protein DASC09_023600 [Saccharomycopsis crataegensis]|uniref:DNA-directed RNA polymerase III subunit RPC9 n=1 Tax=Saccharomycopsis crataegensis TaxID=43959 RepID=A0AAV5QJA6_9ASCO|nr:hypothetical protein DASC09_023600 [Saccharomycopsis crataegensis]